MNMDIIKLIPSKDVRDFCIKMGHEFPDFEKAILIYHLEIEDQEKNRLLTELYSVTRDAILKRQIDEYFNVKESEYFWVKRRTSFLNSYLYIPYPFHDGERVKYTYNSEKNKGIIYVARFEEDLNCWSGMLHTSADWYETTCRVDIDEESGYHEHIPVMFIEYA
jgi:hypothetical protein